MGAITIATVAYVGYLFARLAFEQNKHGDKNKYEKIVGVVGVALCVAAILSVLLVIPPKQSICEIEQKISHSNRQCF
ncbi:hypothetical protein RFM68_25235 [Mesorhizobium sp. MSK_1335]|uniref:Uncharacterized protein n=1 Tax=Mesorhizobium montanum TaxID=3072323 RepID=A0ABU4ZQX5_9HYPH|nr:hypothetical protein [Mesorhizobium sp. MSK_1335]MDX8527806.1 hypothetical protein [Mesorhizobium sp. MSK_1335]